MLANGISGLLKAIERLSKGLRTGWDTIRNELFIVLAWVLITWGIFQLNPRAWAISAGLYLALTAGLAIFAGGKTDVRNSV